MAAAIDTGGALVNDEERSNAVSYSQSTASRSASSHSSRTDDDQRLRNVGDVKRIKSTENLNEKQNNKESVDNLPPSFNSNDSSRTNVNRNATTEKEQQKSAEIENEIKPTLPITASCSQNRVIRFFSKEDALDRFPGFRAWKGAIAVLILAGLGLAVIGLISNSVNNPDKYPGHNVVLKNVKTDKIYGKFWNWIHFFGYFLMALMFPDCWALLFLVGLAWETFELFVGWNDWNDLLYNTAGIALGVAMRKLLIPLTEKITPVKCV